MTKQADIKKKKGQLAKAMKHLDPDTGRPREKDIVAVVRGAVRKAWMRAPTKVSLLCKSAVHVDDVPKELRPPKLTKNTKWLYKCSLEGTYHIGGDIEVDHIVGEHSLKSYEDMVGFTKRILDVGWDDLRVVSKGAHLCKTYSERYGISYEEAKKEKEVIAIMKQGVTKQKAFLKKHGVKGGSNADIRREQIRDIIKEKGNDTDRTSD